ncbi:MAG: hypothetical protein JNG89_01000 [Planctomycetaceae bacterium]|nr:hypothetical protein [Planctomycetaceae bacterium]
MRQIAMALMAFLVAGGLSFADDKVELKYAPGYAAGQVIRAVSESKVNQTLVLAGMNIDTKVESFAATRETVGETVDGKTKLNSEFEYFIVNLETPIGNFNFDSAKSDAPVNAPPQLAPLYDLFKATSKAKWVATLNTKPEIESIAFDGTPFEGLEDSVRSEVSPERFQQEYNLMFRRFPDGPVAVGDTWKRTEESQLGNGQLLRYEREFKYLGPKPESGTTVDLVEMRTLSVQYEIGAGSQLPLKLVSSDLKVESAEGMLSYDRRYHVFTVQTDKVHVVGSLEFSISLNGQEQKLPGELDLTIETKQTSEPVSK